MTRKMKTTRKRIWLSMAAVLIGAMLLAACGGTAEPAEVEAPPPEVEEAAPPAVENVGEESMEEPMEEPPAPVEESAPAEAIEEEMPQLGFELGDPQLKSTDPAGVALASGEVQLVEFFAFW